MQVSFSDLRNNLSALLDYIADGGTVTVRNARAKDQHVIVRLTSPPGDSYAEADAIAATYRQFYANEEPPIQLAAGTTRKSEVDRLVAEHSDLDSLKNRRQR
jgi:antitoxin (DNA-binding transcriptional repressor) of toxin-antitoxin stability system